MQYPLLAFKVPLHSEALRHEIQQGLNVIENWNGANNFILYGKGGKITSDDLENQELIMLSRNENKP